MKYSTHIFEDGDGDDDEMINLTPLIDVVFVVLILFILVAPLLEIDRIALASGSSEKKSEMVPIDQNAPLAIHIYADNSIWVEKKPITEGELLTFLSQIKQEFPLATPQLFPDKEAAFGTYQTVKNAIEMAGFEQMDVILKPGG